MFRLIASAVSLVAIAAASAHAQAEPAKRPALYAKVYVPEGYDSNDHVQVMGEGLFRSACYRHAETRVEVDESARLIRLFPVAYEYSGFCLQVLLPFAHVIDVGLLKAGNWSIVQGERGGALLGSLLVRPATTDRADDFLYAPISQAAFQSDGAGARATLSGVFPNDCLALDRTVVRVARDVITLQPIAKVDERASCRDGKFPFSATVALSNVPPGRYLLHVRSMGGNALNSLVDVR